MNFDIPLAGWVLSAITFIVGMIAPKIYSRLYYDGISIRQLDHRLVSQEKNVSGELFPVFSTICKIANVRKESLLIDNIRIIKPSFKLKDIAFKLNRIDLKFYKPEDNKYLPPANDPDGKLDNLPFIVKSDEVKFIALGFWFRHTSKDSDYVTKIMADFIEAKGLHVAIRANGKYRDYLLQSHPERLN